MAYSLPIGTQASAPQDFSTYAEGYLEFAIRALTGATDLVIAKSIEFGIAALEIAGLPIA